MGNYHYFVRVTERHNDTQFNGTEARAYRQPNYCNLLNAVYNSETIRTLVIHHCDTAREAVELANEWNQAYTNNGKYPAEFIHNGQPLQQHVIDNLY